MEEGRFRSRRKTKKISDVEDYEVFDLSRTSCPVRIWYSPSDWVAGEENCRCALTFSSTNQQPELQPKNYVPNQ